MQEALFVVTACVMMGFRWGTAHNGGYVKYPKAQLVLGVKMQEKQTAMGKELHDEDYILMMKCVTVLNHFEYEDMPKTGVFYELAMFDKDGYLRYVVRNCYDYSESNFVSFFKEINKIIEYTNTISNNAHLRICDYVCYEDTLRCQYTTLAGGQKWHC